MVSMEALPGQSLLSLQKTWQYGCQQSFVERRVEMPVHKAHSHTCENTSTTY